jgi:hypothetical protein
MARTNLRGLRNGIPSIHVTTGAADVGRAGTKVRAPGEFDNTKETNNALCCSESGMIHLRWRHHAAGLTAGRVDQRIVLKLIAE